MATDLAVTVAVNLFCSGAYDGIKRAVAKFKASRFGGASRVDVPDDDR